MQNVKKDQYSIISTQHTDDLKPAMPGSVHSMGKNATFELELP